MKGRIKKVTTEYVDPRTGEVLKSEIKYYAQWKYKYCPFWFTGIFGWDNISLAREQLYGHIGNKKVSVEYLEETNS